MFRTLDDQIAVLDGTIGMAPGVVWPLRSVLVKLKSGDGVLINPGEMSEQDRAAIRAFAPVRHLVAPSGFHHLYLAEAQSYFPGCTTWATERVLQQQPELAVDGILGQRAAPWEGEIRRHYIDGLKGLDEHVLIHRKTLIVTDLVFHLTEVDSRGGRWVAWMMGVLGRLAQSRVMRFLITDRHEASASCKQLLEQRFERVIPAHGAIVDEDAHARLSTALERMIHV